MEKKSYLIPFQSIGESSIGYISVAESAQNIPFEIKRVYWTYFTPENIVRGRHAHRQTEQILIAVAGRITVTVEAADDPIPQVFVLDHPNMGLYIPPSVWHTMQYSHSAVQLVLASKEYDATDYLRNYEEFKQIWSLKN